MSGSIEPPGVDVPTPAGAVHIPAALIASGLVLVLALTALALGRDVDVSAVAGIIIGIMGYGLARDTVSK